MFHLIILCSQLILTMIMMTATALVMMEVFGLDWGIRSQPQKVNTRIGFPYPIALLLDSPLSDTENTHKTPNNVWQHRHQRHGIVIN